MSGFEENEEAGRAIAAAYVQEKRKREELHYWVGYLTTGCLLAATGLSGRDFLGGLKWLYRQGKIHAQVNRQGRAVYVALNHPHAFEREFGEACQ